MQQQQQQAKEEDKEKGMSESAHAGCKLVCLARHAVHALLWAGRQLMLLT